MTTIKQVKQLGQQIWLDNLSRSLVQSGELARFLADGVCGVTSNPAIFQKAFSGDALYIPEIEALKQQNKTAKEIYETLAIADVQAACDVCRAEYDSTGGKTGFVSLEVSPELSHDAERTIAEAQRLWAAINRPNAMIKIPATDAGLEALTTLVANGINVNLTLLFSRKQTLKAYAAYTAGLTQLAANGGNLRGKIAIALAKAAYQDWQDYFARPEFALLAAQGAHRVSLLWASTGVKNPDYPATLYVDALIGEHTVNTVPDATLKAFIATGTAARTLPENIPAALAQLAEVEKLGIDVETLATRLQNDGLKQFEEAFAKLLAPLAA